jgi:hypothetical protein
MANEVPLPPRDHGFELAKTRRPDLELFVALLLQYSLPFFADRCKRGPTRVLRAGDKFQDVETNLTRQRLPRTKAERCHFVVNGIEVLLLLLCLDSMIDFGHQIQWMLYILVKYAPEINLKT